MWSLLALLAILWNYGNCQDTDLTDSTIDLYQGIGTNPADIVFLLDTSTSNDVDLYNKIRAFLVQFVENSSVESGAVRFAFVPYTSYPDVKFYLNKYTRKADIITAIRNATFNYGERNTADAFDLLRRQVFTEGNGDRPQVPNIVLMITTGTSDRNSYRTIQEAEALRFAGVGIFAIGIGLTNAREIEAMASRPTRENTFQLTSVDDLEAMRDIIFAHIFTRADQSFRSPVTGSEQLDLIFLLHFSNNMRKESLNLVLEFVQNLLEYADIDSGQVRVGISIYRKIANSLYNLDRFSTKGELMEGIQQITTQYKAKAANTAAGLDFLRTDAFVEKAGDRPNVPNAVIIITDANTNVDQADAITAAEALKAAGTAIFSIGIGLENPDELDALATSRDFSLAVTQASELNSNLIYIQEKIVALRTQSDLPAATLPTITSPILINAVLRARDLRTTIRPTTLVDNRKEADVVLAFHSSKETKVKDFKKGLFTLFSELVSSADVDSGAVRFALVGYGQNASVIFGFNSYRRKKKLLKALKKVKPTYRSRESNALDLILKLKTEVFSGNDGDRSGVPNIMILVTDSPTTAPVTEIGQNAKIIKDRGISVFSIGVEKADPMEISAMASEPISKYSYSASTYYEMLNSADLKDKLSKAYPIFEGIGSQKDVSTTKKPGKKTKSTGPPQKKTKGTIKPQTKTITTSRAAVVQETTTVAYKTSVMKTDIPTNRTVKLLETSPYKEAITGLVVRDTTLPGTKVVIADREDISRNFTTTSLSSQNVAPPLSGSEKADIVFALHLSNRANDREVRTVLNYLNSLISGSDVDNGRVNIGLLTYNEDAEVIFNINQYNSVPLIRNEVLRTESRTRSSNVDASAALAVGTQMLNFIYSERSDAPKALIFVTDSASTENEELIPFERFRVDAEQVNVFSIGIGLSGKEELESLATAPENVLTVSRYSELPSTIDDLKRKIFAFRTRDEKAVPEPETPESTKPEPPIRTLAPPRQDDKGITIVPRNPPEEPDIEAGPAKVTSGVANAKPGTVVRSPQTCGLAKVDLVIILDASTSVSEPNYKKMLAFCKDFLKDADIDSGSVRVGIVIYSTAVQIQFHLNRYSTKSTLFAAIDKIPYIYGSTNTAGGLNTMRTKMFIPANGDRPDVNNVAMIMTDGVSNINDRNTIPEAELARAAGIHIYAIGIGLSDTKELNAMASPPASENSFSVTKFDELAGLAEKIFSSVCPGTTTTRLPPPTTKTTTKARTTTLTTTTTPLTTPSMTTKLASTAVPACGLAKVDLVIVLDASTSVTQPNYKKMLSFCKDFLKDADIDSGSVRVGIVIYSTDVQIQFHLNQYSTKAAVFQAIDKIPYIYGSTNTADGLKTMRTQMYTPANGDRPDVSNVALVMTDGISNINAKKTIPEAEQARAAGIHIYAIGIGLSDTKELDAIATPPARENSFAVQDFNELAGLAVQIFSSICPVVPTTPKPQEKTTAPAPVTTKRIPSTTTTLPTTKTTTVTTTMRTTIITQSTTTIAPTTAKSLLACGLAKVDLVIILDASTSVTEANYKKMLTFCKDFLGNADIDSGNVRVGVVIYSTNVNIQFHLKQYSKRSDIFAAIDKIPYIYGSTNTANGLKTMRTEMFTIANGDRPDADNVAIIITDGISNINAQRTVPEALLARAMGIHIYAIGIGLSDSKELDAIASEPAKDNSFSIQEFDELVGLENKIFSAICLDTVPPPTIPLATPAPTMMSTNILILDIEEMQTEPPPSACADAQVDLVYILDASTSVTEVNFVKMLDFCKQLIEDAEIDNGNVQVGVVVYSSDVRVEFYLNEYNTRSKVIDAIGRIKYTYGSTNTAGGLKTMREQLFSFRNGDRPEVPNIAIILTDGVSNINAGRTVPEAELARADGIHIYAIGIGLPDTRELDAIASKPASENSFSVRSFDELKGIKQKVFSSLCPGETRTTTRKPTTPTPTTPKPTTTTKATTTTTKPTTPKPTPSTTKPTTTKTTTPTTPKPTPTTTKSTTKPTTPRPTTTTPRPTTTTPRKTTTTPRRDGYDLVMVLDSSVNSSTFNWMMDVTRDTIRELNIDDEEWRVGIVTYSTNPNREFNLNQYKKKADVLKQVDRISYRPGQTNTASALKYVRTNMFRESNGDRNFAKNYVILITGNEKSLDMYAAAEESYQMQRDGVATYVIGLGINDKTELDELASLPLADYEVIIPAPNQIGEKPGEVIYDIRSRSPTPNPPPQRSPRPRTTLGPDLPLEDLVCKSTGDIVFILDSSGSVGLENFYRVLNFTYNTVHQLDIESGNFRVALITFSDSARIEFYLNTYKKRGEIEPALQKVRYVYGSTHTAAALRRVRQEIFRAEAGDRPDVPNIVVMVTDGNSNVNHEMTLVEADMLKRAGVSMITVAVGFQRETRELVGLTSAPVEENLIYADDYRSLEKLSRKLLEPLCTDSDLCRTSPCRNDAVCVDGIRSYMCLCPESYYGTNCEKQCSEPADVAFILDSSNTVGESSFQRMKDYVGSLIMEMNVEACNINIGLMKYSSAPMIQWGLGTYHDTDANIRAVNQVHYTRGVANMAAALKSLRTDIFNGRGGDRPKAKNIAYLLTDGSNNVHMEETQKNAELAISSGIRIIPVGVSLRDREDVDLIAGAQDLNTIILDETIGEINEAALAPMVRAKDFCAGNPCKNGGKCLNESFGFTCECPVGFTGEDCTRRCSAGGDVVFAVDTSRYVTRKEMKRVRRFLRSIVKRLRFKEFKTGLVQYSNTANVVLTFADGDKKKNVLTAIAGLRNMVGDPDAAEALAKANFRIFKGDGAMADQPDYLVLLSKGLKNEEELLIQSNRLKMRGTRILGVGVSLTGSEKELMESVVSYPSSNTAYYADDVDGLDDVADKVVEFMCNGQDKCAQNPCQNKGKCHAIGAEYYCDCPHGFAGKNCELKCDAKADIVFLLDSSGSVGHVDFRKVKDFAYRMIDDLNIGKDQTRVGLVAYSSRSRHGFYLKDYYEKNQLQNAISSIEFEYGKTNTADGLRHVREKLFNAAVGDRPDAQNFVVVITDGLSNIKSEQTIVEADLMKSNGVHVYAIGIGKFDRYEIDRIASAPPSKNAFILEDYASLASISSDIIRATCKDPSVCDENPCRNDGRCEPTMNGPICKCTGGYRGTYCEISCVSRKDIIFVLDSSSSVGEENFELALEFVSSVVEELSRGGSDNKYAMITFSNDVQLVFSLGRYSSAGIILNAIKYTRYRPGSTNTAGGLRTALEISSPEYGDRKDVDNIVILVADGQSNVNTEDTIPAADDLKKTGAKIITIGVGLSNYQELESIGSGAENVYKVNTYNLLGDVKADILENSCSEND